MRKLCFCVGIALACASSRAALAPLSPSDLRKYAEIIIDGTVESSKESKTVDADNCVTFHYEVAVHVTAIEKGSLALGKETIVVHGWKAGDGIPVKEPNGIVHPAICGMGEGGV